MLSDLPVGSGWSYRLKKENTNALTVRGRRFRKWLLGSAITFAVYVLAGFFVLPPILKWQMKKQPV